MRIEGRIAKSPKVSPVASIGIGGSTGLAEEFIVEINVFNGAT